jgi:hypothetical protein
MKIKAIIAFLSNMRCTLDKRAEGRGQRAEGRGQRAYLTLLRTAVSGKKMAYGAAQFQHFQVVTHRERVMNNC